MMKYFHGRTIKMLILSMLLLLTLSAPASAAIIGFVAEGPDGIYYEYNYDDLVESYVARILGISAPMYDDYAKKPVKVILDSVNSYVDYNDVLEAYVSSIISGTSFDVNVYTASAKVKKATMPSSILVVTQGNDSKLVFTEKVLGTIDELLDRINKAADADEMRVAVLEKAKELGLTLTTYNSLNAYGRKAAFNEVLTKRPQGGFESAKQVKDTFDSAVVNAKAAMDAAFKAINDASSASNMKTALTNNDVILELGLVGYSLSSKEMDTLAGKILGEKPYAKIGELKTILNIHVLGIRTGSAVMNTRYSITLKGAVDAQMATNPPPQTDLYGGGWKDATRSDVEFYVNPYNFIDTSYSGAEKEEIKITSPSLRVRERPTTKSPQLKNDDGVNINVLENQVYTILATAEAEAGTDPGTEGPWYKISVQGKEGWVCGQYVTKITTTQSSSMFQFLILSGSAGTTVEDLNRILSGKGILNNQGVAFMDGSVQHNINEIFLVSLGLHESGNGTSKLAMGVEVEDVDNVTDQDFVKVYNMFGIGANDSNPTFLGAQFAYKERWFTPEEAIIGGASFASKSYVNHPTHFQDTLYKMRWNPGNPGKHQYATDMGWAAKQVTRIKSLYDQIDNYTLKFDIPRYKQ
jgi:beta-N-acetylglucosaminidase